jgi:glyoxylase-like metal-dependent hydrolase (beta-lactamase superfamily II)
MDEATREAVVIDPGDEPDRILIALAQVKARPIALLHTHAHFDHIGGTGGVARATHARVRLSLESLRRGLALSFQLSAVSQAPARGRDWLKAVS